MGRRARTAAGSAVINCVTPGPHVTEATAILPVATLWAVAAATVTCSCLTWTDCTPGSLAKAVDQCMLPSPIRTNCVSTPSARKASARASYSLGIARDHPAYAVISNATSMPDDARSIQGKRPNKITHQPTRLYRGLLGEDGLRSDDTTDSWEARQADLLLVLVRAAR